MNKIEIPLSKTKLLLGIGGSVLFVVLGLYFLTTMADQQTRFNRILPTKYIFTGCIYRISFACMNNLEEKRISMVSMIEDWRSSGKSKRQYCLEKGINEARFYYWYSRVNEKESVSGRFIPIKKRSNARDIELLYPNGVKLKVNGDLLLLAQLIHLY